MNNPIATIQENFARHFPEGIHLPKKLLSPDSFKNFLHRHSRVDGPLMIIYVRHGRSAGNERENVEALGPEHAALKEYYSQFEDHDYPLVNVGREQARSAGRQIGHLWHTGVIPSIDRTFCSPFTRTKETLKELINGVVDYCSENNINPEKVVHGNVEILALIGERYWHDFNKLPKEEQDRQYKKRTKNAFFWIPGTAGEQIQEVYNRARDFAQKVHRPQFKGKVILVCSHGEFISASELAFLEMDPTSKEFEKAFDIGVPNCGIYAFSRAPIKAEMQASEAKKINGFDYFMKCAPYELEGKDREKFQEWDGNINWQRRPNRRIDTHLFPHATQLSVESRALAAELEKAGIGERSVRSRI